jgi:hypothetical protein
MVSEGIPKRPPSDTQKAKASKSSQSRLLNLVY